MMIMSKKDTQSENKKETGNSIKAYEVIREGSVLDNIASTYVASSEGINFAEAPGDGNGKGIYIRSGTENNQYPIYYYRGEVTNNNVIFADFCWKIVRTTETGGIKLIYNGIPSDGKCNNTNEASQIGKSKFNDKDDDNAYVGYMYGTPNSNTYEETHDNISADSHCRLAVARGVVIGQGNYVESQQLCHVDNVVGRHIHIAAGRQTGMQVQIVVILHASSP